MHIPPMSPEQESAGEQPLSGSGGGSEKNEPREQRLAGDPIMLSVKEFKDMMGSVVQDSGRLHCKFDLSSYETLMEQSICRELIAENLPAIGALYRSSEMSSDAFQAYLLDDYEDAEAVARRGGMIDQWETIDQDVLRELLKESNGKYVSSKEEFQEFLEHKYKRAAEFKAWGLFDADGNLHAMVSAFLPPINPGKRELHGKQLKKFFKGNNERVPFFPRADFHLEYIQDNLQNTAELYLITSLVKGGGTVVCDHMLKELEGRGITTWYLLRFGSLRMISPKKDQRPVGDAENEESGKFFGRRNFKNFGTCRMINQVAARKVQNDTVVVVEPTWNIMLGSNEKFKDGNNDEMVHMQRNAAEEKESNPRKS